jgi:hypothetical protein
MMIREDKIERKLARLKKRATEARQQMLTVRRDMLEQTNNKRTRVLKLLSTGHLTQAEAAVLAGVTRQRIHQWVTAAGLHPTLARKRYLRELVRNANI